MDYLHDGSFEGVLTGIYQMFHNKARIEEDQLLQASTYQMTLWCSYQTVVSDRDQAYKVARSIMDTFGEDGFKVVLYSYLYEAADYGTLLFKFLKRAYKIGSNAVDCLSDEAIFNVYKLYRAVTRESHLMLGILRFAQLDKDIYYAQYEPTYDLTGILAPHFAERLKDQLWVIHDTKRGIGAFYDGQKWFLQPIDAYEQLKFSKEEAKYQELWKRYFDHIAIVERKNPKCQMNFMPKKYWKFLTEKTFVLETRESDSKEN